MVRTGAAATKYMQWTALGLMERQRAWSKGMATVLAALLSSFLQAARVGALHGSPVTENGSWAAEEAEGNASTEHTFFSLDYQHVQVPFEITLWIMLASLAKIGEVPWEGEEGWGGQGVAVLS